MLDFKYEYYVVAGSFLRSVLEAWANENAMRLVGDAISILDREPLSMPGKVTYVKAYRLDVQCSNSLKIGIGSVFGEKCLALKKGEKAIGRVYYECAEHETRVAIEPEIRDR